MSADRAAPRVSWDELMAMTPDVIRETFPMVRWDMARLRALSLPVQRVAVQDLAWQFDLPLWQLNGVRFQVSPGQVRDDPARFPDHRRRVMASDLRYPIHLIRHSGRLVVLDGFHRLLKAVLQGQAQIDAMVLSQQDLELISPA
jgi:hypothetical protein